MLSVKSAEHSVHCRSLGRLEPEAATTGEGRLKAGLPGRLLRHAERGN